MTIQTPNTCLYPEIAVASKMEHIHHTYFGPPRALSEIVWPLSNSGSIAVRRVLASQKFYVRFSENETEQNRPIILTLQENGLPLVRRGHAPESTMI